MTPAERTATVAKARALDLASVCWAPSPRGDDSWCGGPVTWSEGVGNSLHSVCARCNATGCCVTAVEAGAIRRLFGRSAVECQGGEP